MKKILILWIGLLLMGCQNTSNQPINNETIVNNHIATNNQVIVENDEESVEFAYDVNNRSGKFSNEDLIYFIMVDRFKDGDDSNDYFSDSSDNPNQLKSYLGGDLQGVIDELDYIKGLGATTIWLSPIVKNEPYGYHGYWAEDFYAVDPHFGDLETLKNLVTEAHNRDIKVILDYVVNHTGYNHPWTKDSAKEDWFHHNGTITNYNDQDQVENYNLAGLPDLNTENPAVKAYFFENALYWIKETGIDGMRLDTVRHVPQTFWNEFAYVIKSEYPDFFFLGEVWKNSVSYLDSYHQIGLDSITNYALFDGIDEAFRRYGDAQSLKLALLNESKFTDPDLNAIFIDNHDVSRLISRSSKYGEEYLKEALTFVMLHPSIPVIYYGTEIGLEGKNDPDNRRLMDWEINFEDNAIYSYYQTLLDIRNETRDFKNFEILEAKSSHIVIQYTNGSKKMITAYNVSEYNQSVELTLTGTYKNLLTGETVDISNITLEPITSMILMEE
ncbi:MAG: alpha-amylase [Clostridia bacterium]|nr:alpha-amylase [Clostridia bacterium]